MDVCKHCRTIFFKPTPEVESYFDWPPVVEQDTVRWDPERRTATVTVHTRRAESKA